MSCISKLKRAATVSVFATSLGMSTVAPGADKPRAAKVSEPSEFAQAIAAIRADASNYDKFKEPVRNSLSGRSFEMRLPFASYAGSSGASYDYEAGKLLLGLKAGSAWSLRRSPSDRLPVIVALEDTRSLGSYVGQNAFGARTQVKSFKNEGAGIALITVPKFTLRGASYAAGMTIGGDKGWWFERELPPSEAKALALASSAVIDRVYADLPWGGPGFCDFGGVSATLDHPTDYYSQKCYIGANVRRIAFVNDATGEVLKEWTIAANPQLGAELWRGIRLGMSTAQIKAAWPAMTDYGYLDLGGGQSISVRMGEDGVSSVVLNLPYSTSSGAFRTLVAQYGQPAVSRCIVRDLCYGRWNFSKGVSAYLTAGGTVTYQSVDAPPPIGF